MTPENGSPAPSGRVLLRTYLNPLLPTDVSTASSQIGKNSGNLIFSFSTQRLVSAPGAGIATTHFTDLMSQVSRINDEQRHVVIPLANSFRPTFASALTRLARFINRLTVPVTILGVGAQGSLDYEIEANPDLDEAVTAFVSAVLDHGPTIGVRGQFTADYLASLGFSDTTVIGCPSMFLKGPDLTIRERPSTLEGSWPRDARLAISLDPSVTTPAGWTHHLAEQHPAMRYVAQTSSDLSVILGGKAVYPANPEYPGRQSHPLMADDRAVCYLHAPTWITAMADLDFVFGHRIHGNVAALLAGTPAHVIAHDSRTRELADYFQIPHTLAPRITSETRVEELYERSDWTPLVSGHAARVERLAQFLDSHRLPPTARTSWGAAPLERELNGLGLWGPEVVISPRSQDPASLNARISNVDGRLRTQIAQLERKNAELARELRETRAHGAHAARPMLQRAKGALRKVIR